MKRKTYDIVVVGSGIGGMCAAALLAHYGYKTLVAEKLALLGGRCSSYSYKGFTLTTGAMSVYTDGPIGETFKEVGAKLEVRPHSNYYYRLEGKDYPTPERGGLRALIASAGGEGVAEQVMAAIRRGISWQEPSSRLCLEDWLLQYTHNEKVLGIFRGLLGAIHGVSPADLSAAEFIHYIEKTSILRQVGFAYKGNLSLMESLANVVRARGGEIWLSSRVRRILVSDGVVRGVVVHKGKDEIEIAARAVISDVGPRKTVALAGSDNFDCGYLREVEETLRPAGYIWIALASNKPLIDCPGLILTKSRRVSVLLCPTLLCPELAPQGKHLLYSGGVLGSSLLAPVNPKKEIELNMLDLRENLPGFDREAEVLLTSSFYGEWPLYLSAPGYDLTQKTPVENLYNVGDAVKPQGMVGLPACTQTARIVVEDIKRRLKPAAA